MSEKEINIGVSQISFSLPLQIAKEKKLFEAAGLRVSFFSDYTEAESMCMDVVSKKLDVAGMVALPIILEQETKNIGSLQISNIAFEDDDHPFVYLLTKQDVSFKNITGLKGKKIGIFPTAAFHLWLDILLKKFKLSTSDVEIIPVDPSKQQSALLEGTIDVLFTNDPSASEMLKTRDIKKVINESILSSHVLPATKQFPVGGFVLQRDFVRDFPTEAEILVQVIDTAISMIEESYAATLNYWKDTEIDKGILQQLTDIYYHNDLFESPLNVGLLMFEPKYKVCFDQVEKNRDATKVLHDLTFDFNKADFITVFGPNGSGKTTILSMLAGIVKPDSGMITIDGKPVHEQKVGYVYQDYRKILMPWKTVIENIGFPLKSKGLSIDVIHKEVRDLCTLLEINLPLEKYPFELSGGQQQMTAILAALIDKPEVLLFDEPFSAIDYQTTISMQEKIMDIWQKLGITILFVSHDIDEAVFLANKVCLLTKKPTRVKKVFLNTLPYPRSLVEKETSEFVTLKNEILAMYSKEVDL